MEVAKCLFLRDGIDWGGVMPSNLSSQGFSGGRLRQKRRRILVELMHSIEYFDRFLKRPIWQLLEDCVTV